MDVETNESDAVRQMRRGLMALHLETDAKIVALMTEYFDAVLGASMARGRAVGLTQALTIAERLVRDFGDSESCSGNLNRTRESRGANCVWTAIQAELDKGTP